VRTGFSVLLSQAVAWKKIECPDFLVDWDSGDLLHAESRFETVRVEYDAGFVGIHVPTDDVAGNIQKILDSEWNARQTL